VTPKLLVWKSGGWHRQGEIDQIAMRKQLVKLTDFVRGALEGKKPGTVQINPYGVDAILYRFEAVNAGGIVAKGVVSPAYLDKTYQYRIPKDELGDPIPVEISTRKDTKGG